MTEGAAAPCFVNEEMFVQWMFNGCFNSRFGQKCGGTAECMNQNAENST